MTPSIRKPSVAGRFYPDTPQECSRFIQNTPPFKPPLLKTLVGGIVPHAGWIYSGSLALSVIRQLAQQNSPPETIVLFGAVHLEGVPQATLAPEEYWETPLGLATLDREFANHLPFPQKTHAHQREHSLEVQLPFLQHYFPHSAYLPLAVPPGIKALEAGQTVAHVAQNLSRKILVLGSTDLTHYGESYHFTPKGTGIPALQWVKEENDARMISLILNLHTKKIFEEAQKSYNACGSGAIIATLSCLQTLYPQLCATLDHYTTSFDVQPGDRQPRSFVGYAGILFSAP
jgi:AmmeMemoRadiSam system protein B